MWECKEQNKPSSRPDAEESLDGAEGLRCPAGSIRLRINADYVSQSASAAVHLLFCPNRRWTQFLDRTVCAWWGIGNITHKSTPPTSWDAATLPSWQCLVRSVAEAKSFSFPLFKRGGKVMSRRQSAPTVLSLQSLCCFYIWR